jgi:hypothetical protein
MQEGNKKKFFLFNKQLVTILIAKILLFEHKKNYFNLKTKCYKNDPFCDCQSQPDAYMLVLPESQSVHCPLCQTFVVGDLSPTGFW